MIIISTNCGSNGAAEEDGARDVPVALWGAVWSDENSLIVRTDGRTDDRLNIFFWQTWPGAWSMFRYIYIYM